MTRPCSSPARNSMVRRRSQTGALPSRSMSARRAMEAPSAPRGGAGRYGRRASPGEPPLDGGDQEVGGVHSALLLELADAGRARHVDLGHEAADHIEADEEHPLRGECRPDLAGEPAVALVERAADTPGTGREVAAMVPGAGDAGECEGHRLALDEEHPRVPRLRDVGNVALRDRVALAVLA